MTKPMRRALLNAEISLAARKLAHAATRSCSHDRNYGKSRGDLPNDDEHHTPKCNALKRGIEQLVMSVKLAQLQPPEQRELPPLPFGPEA